MTDRSERRGDGAATRIDGDHCEYFECGKLGWILFDVPSYLDRAECSGDFGKFEQRCRESEQYSAHHVGGEGQEWDDSDRPHAGVRVDDADDDSGGDGGNGDPYLPGCGGDYGGLPTAKLQSFAVQPDRSVRQREAGDLKPDYRDRTGLNSTNLYIASTNSLYLVPVDFTQPQIGSPVRLPYQPNSMVISNDGSSIYMGSAFELMTFSAVSNTLTNQDTSVTGSVLAVSPDGTTLVITDPIRQFVYLYNPSGAGGTAAPVGQPAPLDSDPVWRRRDPCGVFAGQPDGIHHAGRLQLCDGSHDAEQSAAGALAVHGLVLDDFFAGDDGRGAWRTDRWSVFRRKSDDSALVLPGDDDIGWTRRRLRRPQPMSSIPMPVCLRQRRAALRRLTMDCIFWERRRRRSPIRFYLRPQQQHLLLNLLIPACRSATVRIRRRKTLRQLPYSAALCRELRRRRLRASFRRRIRKLRL